MFQHFLKISDSVTVWIGRAVSWLVLIMVFIIVYDVSVRFLFHQGSVALQELEWHLFALIFLLGAAYTYHHDNHVRVDIFYHSGRLTDKHRALINILGSLFLFFPFCLLVIFSSTDFVFNAYRFNEGSPDPGGLPFRYLLKAAIPLGFALLLLQGLKQLVDAVQLLRAKSDEGAL